MKKLAFILVFVLCLPMFSCGKEEVKLTTDNFEEYLAITLSHENETQPYENSYYCDNVFRVFSIKPGVEFSHCIVYIYLDEEEQSYPFNLSVNGSGELVFNSNASTYHGARWDSFDVDIFDKYVKKVSGTVIIK